MKALDFIESLYPSQPVRDVVVSITLLEGHIVQMERLVFRYLGGSEAGEDTGVQASREEDTNSGMGTLLTGVCDAIFADVRLVEYPGEYSVTENIFKFVNNHRYSVLC